MKARSGRPRSGRHAWGVLSDDQLLSLRFYDPKPAIADAERHLRRFDRHGAGRQRRLDDLPQFRIVRRLAVVAGANRHIEGARIESAEARLLQAFPGAEEVV